MVWGAIGYSVKSNLVFLQSIPKAKRKGVGSTSYISCLNTGLLPIYKDWHYFMQDNAPAYTAYDTEEYLTEIWDSIELDEVERLLDSMAARLYAVVAAKGWYTKY